MCVRVRLEHGPHGTHRSSPEHISTTRAQIVDRIRSTMSPTSPSRHRRHRLHRRLSSERPCMPTFVTGVARVSRRLGVELVDQIRDVWFRVVSNRRLGFEFWSLLPVVGHAGIVILLSGRRQEGHPQQGHELQGRQSGGRQGRQGSVRLSHDCGVSSSTRSEMFGFEFYPTGGLVSSFGVYYCQWLGMPA